MYYWQNTATWCGPATGQNVLDSLGLPVPEQWRLALAMREDDGVTTGQFRRGIAKYGVRTRLVRGGVKAWRESLKRGEVLVIFVLSHVKRESHFVLVDDYDPCDDTIHLRDPSWIPRWKDIDRVYNSLVDRDVVGCRRATAKKKP